MARGKKETEEVVETPAVEAATASEPEAPAPKDTKVFSLRKGDVVLKDGQVIKFRQPALVSKEDAEWLVDFDKDIQIV